MLIVGIGVAKEGRKFTGALGAAQAGVVFRGAFFVFEARGKVAVPETREGIVVKGKVIVRGDRSVFNGIVYPFRVA